MGKHKNATKAGRGAQRDTFPTPSFSGGEPEDTSHDLLEEVSLQMGTSPKASSRFMQSSRLPAYILCHLRVDGHAHKSQTIGCIIVFTSE